MVLLIIIPNYPYEKWLFHWEYTQHFQTNPIGCKSWLMIGWRCQHPRAGSPHENGMLKRGFSGTENKVGQRTQKQDGTQHTF